MAALMKQVTKLNLVLKSLQKTSHLSMRSNGKNMLYFSSSTGSTDNSASEWLESRKVDITSGKQIYLFDTHEAIRNLQHSGLSAVQSQAVIETLVQVTQAQLDHNQKNLVTKAQQEIATQQLMSNIGAVRKDMIILEKSEFSQLKHEYEKQHIELQQQRTTLIDEMTKLRSSLSLDLNIERARSKDAHAENEKRVTELGNRLDVKFTEFEAKIDTINSKIAKEVAELLAIYERYRHDLLKYAVGSLMSCIAICLGFYRLWKTS